MKEKIFGTLVEPLRSKRAAVEFKEGLERGLAVDSQLDVKWKSESAFKNSFSKILDAKAVNRGNCSSLLKASWLDTKLGAMVAISDDERLCLLKFVDQSGLEKKIEGLKRKQGSLIMLGETAPITKVREELDLYFSGKLKEFHIPISMIGSAFQAKAWNALIRIPYGKTRSYLEQAKEIGNPKAFRAVANANGANPLTVVVPCHRIINSNGGLGGYGGGEMRKQWLIDHERQYL